MKLKFAKSFLCLVIVCAMIFNSGSFYCLASSDNINNNETVKNNELKEEETEIKKETDLEQETELESETETELEIETDVELETEKETEEITNEEQEEETTFEEIESLEAVDIGIKFDGKFNTHMSNNDSPLENNEETETYQYLRDIQSDGYYSKYMSKAKIVKFITDNEYEGTLVKQYGENFELYFDDDVLTIRINVTGKGEGPTSFGVGLDYPSFKFYPNIEEIYGLDNPIFDENGQTSLAQMFSGCKNLRYIDGLEKMYVYSVKDFSMMFYECSSLKNIDLSEWDIYGVGDINLAGMFFNCYSVEEITLPARLNDAMIENAALIFQNCDNLKKVNNLTTTEFYTDRFNKLFGDEYTYAGVKKLNIIENDKFYFGYDWHFTGLGLGMYYDLETATVTIATIPGSKVLFSNNFNLQSMINLEEVKFSYNLKTDGFYYTFANLSNLKSVDLHEVDVSSCTTFEHMFENCINLTNINIEGFDTKNVSNMNYMFSGCESLTDLDLSGLDTSSVTRMEFMFNGCRSLENLDLTGFNTSNVTDMSSMFRGCKSLEALDVSDFDTSKVTSMLGMFVSCESLKEIDVSNFNTSQVINMNLLFDNCASIKELDLSNFDTSKVVKMDGMFNACISLETVDVSSFDTSNVSDMNSMFANCRNVKELDLSNFDTSNVSDMNGMFANCRNVTELDLSNFDTSNLKDINYMFFGMNNLENLDISNFDLNNVNKSNNVFDETPNLNDIKIPENIEDMQKLNYEVKIDYEINDKNLKFKKGFSPVKTRKIGQKIVLPIENDLEIPNGYTFIGWRLKETNEPITEIKEAYTKNAICVLEYDFHYFINYDLDGGNFVEDYEPIVKRHPSEKIVLPTDINLNKEKCVFAGFKDMDSENSEYITQIDANKDYNLKAVWVKYDYSIKYDLNNLHIKFKEGFRPTKVRNYGEKVVLPNENDLVVPANIKVLGWKLLYSNSDEIVNEIPKNHKKDEYCVLMYENLYAINYDLSGGAFAKGYETVQYRQNGEKTKLPTNSEIHKDGYVFLGWQDTNYTTEKIVTVIDCDKKKNYNLKALWAKSKYTITYDLNGGSFVSGYKPIKEANYNDTVVLEYGNKVATKNGYNLVGFKDGNNKIYTINNINRDYNLTAIWEQVVSKYQIKYELNGGKFLQAEPQTHQTNSLTYLPRNDIEYLGEWIVKAGYEFGGWYKEPTFVNRIYILNSNNYKGEILYAKWNQILNNKMSAMNIEYIKDIKMVVETNKQAAEKKLKNNGYTMIDTNLNDGTKGKHIYIGYITTTDKKEAIKAIGERWFNDSGRNPKTYIGASQKYNFTAVTDFNGKQWNTNEGANNGSRWVYLYTTKDENAGNPIKKIDILTLKNSATFTEISKNNEYSPVINSNDNSLADFNRGNKGNRIYIRYSK